MKLRPEEMNASSSRKEVGSSMVQPKTFPPKQIDETSSPEFPSLRFLIAMVLSTLLRGWMNRRAEWLWARPSNWRSGFRHFDQQLAQIFAAEQLQERFWKSFKPFYDVLARLQFVRRHPARHFPRCFAETRRVIEHHKAFHSCAIDQKRKIIGWAGDGRSVVVLRNGPTDGDARASGKLGKNGIQNFTAHIVEINVHAFWAMLLQGLLDIFALVVNGGIEAQFLDNVAALLGASGNSHHPAALNLSDLSSHHAHCPGRARNHHRLPGFRLAYVEQAEIGGHTRHAQCAQIDWQRCESGI